MKNRALQTGDPIEVEREDGNFDWGTFLAYDFEGEEGYLIYEQPPVVLGERLRETIRLVPLDGIREVKRMDG